MKTTNLFSLLIVLGTLILAGCQGAGDRTGDTTDSVGAIEQEPDNTGVAPDTAMGQQGTAALDENTREFVMEASTGNMLEVQLGELAQQKAVNQRVKNFGSMMVRDHNRANDELKSLMSGRDVNLATTLENEHQRKINKLQEKQGTEFDRAYIKQMVDDHQDEIRKYEEITREANDPGIRNYANNTLMVLRVHLDSAKIIRDAITDNNNRK